MGFAVVLALFQVSSNANRHGRLLQLCTCNVIALHLCCCSKAVKLILFGFKMESVPEGHSVCSMLSCDIFIYRPHETAMLEQGLEWCELDWAIAAGGFKVAYQLVWPEVLKRSMKEMVTLHYHCCALQERLLALQSKLSLTHIFKGTLTRVTSYPCRL